MILVTVKSKFQIVIPHEIARQLNIKVGDLLEASVERGELVYTPKHLVDRKPAIKKKN